MTWARRWVWSWWHTRPGHTPHAMMLHHTGVYCAACGSRMPGTGRP